MILSEKGSKKGINLSIQKEAPATGQALGRWKMNNKLYNYLLNANFIAYTIINSIKYIDYIIRWFRSCSQYKSHRFLILYSDVITLIVIAMCIGFKEAITITGFITLVVFNLYMPIVNKNFNETLSSMLKRICTNFQELVNKCIRNKSH